MRKSVLTGGALIVAAVAGFVLGIHAQTDHKRITTQPLAPGAPPRPFSHAVMAGDTLYLSGTVGNDPKTGIPPAVFADAVRQAIANQTEALKAAGLGWRRRREGQRLREGHQQVRRVQQDLHGAAAGAAARRARSSQWPICR